MFRVTVMPSSVHSRSLSLGTSIKPASMTYGPERATLDLRAGGESPSPQHDLQRQGRWGGGEWAPVDCITPANSRLGGELYSVRVPPRQYRRRLVCAGPAGSAGPSFQSLADPWHHHITLVHGVAYTLSNLCVQNNLTRYPIMDCGQRGLGGGRSVCASAIKIRFLKSPCYCAICACCYAPGRTEATSAPTTPWLVAAFVRPK